jgi:hypothetical protein
VSNEGTVIITQNSCAHERELSIMRDAKDVEARRDADTTAARTRHVAQLLANEYREEFGYVVDRYRARASLLVLQQQQCESGLMIASRRQENLLAESTLTRTIRGPSASSVLAESLVTERYALTGATRDLQGEAGSTLGCSGPIHTQRADITTALANPERLLAEAESVRLERHRLRPEFRRQLHSLAQSVNNAYEIAETGTSYDVFVLQLKTLTEQLRSIHSQYAIPIEMGDHRALLGKIYAACVGLAEVDPEWQKQRLIADALTTAQANVTRQRMANSPTVAERATLTKDERWLQDTQKKSDLAKVHLAAKQQVVGRLVAEATKDAAQDRRLADAGR